MALRDDRYDVDRLFEGLVHALAAHGPDRLRRPIQVSEIYQRIVPYRRYRAQFGFDTNQDYETALLRLLAGHGGYVTVYPPEAQETLSAEADAPNPDPALVREFAGATVRLDQTKTHAVLGDEGRFAPPPAEPEQESPPFELAPEPPVQEAVPAGGDTSPRASAPAADPICRNCGRTLPLHRAVVYCPFCGHLAGVRTCRQCGDDLEDGWRFCAGCGTPARGDG